MAAPNKECTAVGWASFHIEKLREGQTVTFRPRGHSMQGKISSGQLCTVEPIAESSPPIARGDIVLCTVKGSQYLHLVLAEKEGRYQIGNNRGGINGWVGAAQIHGRCVKVED